MKYKNYYAALGLPRDADLDQIKKAYRKLARKNHPDLSKDKDAEERFKDVGEAYATLKDPEKRAAYDALGQQPEGFDFSPPPQWRNHYEPDAGGFGDLGDIDLADLLAAMGRKQAQGSRGPVPGRDYQDTVPISLADAHHGTTMNLSLQDTEGGRTLEVKIPPGVTDGQRLRLRGKGGKGHQGGADGDIYLHIAIQPHPLFRVDQRDLFFDLMLSPWEAALGAELEVPTLDGNVLLTVPPGTRAGRKLRLRGRGLSHSRGTPGDLYAVVQIDVAPALTEPERALYQQLAKASSFNPRKPITTEAPHANP
jgi:curved DNA-binding protein